MKVYTAERYYQYEGFQIIGIYTTKEAAQKCCDEDVSESGRKNGDYHEVHEHELLG